jgi:hypothetical protein
MAEPVVERSMAWSVPLAVPSALRGSAGRGIKWVVKVEDPRRSIPARSLLANDAVVASTNGWRADARASRDGVVFRSDSVGIALATGLSIAEARAGRFQRLAFGMWGGIDRLLIELSLLGRRRLLRGWLTTAASGAEPGMRPTGTDTRCLSIDDAAALHVDIEGDLRAVIDQWLDRGILR